MALHPPRSARVIGSPYMSATECVSNVIESVGWLFVEVLHLRSDQDKYRLVTMHTHGDFVMLPNWETRLPVACPDIPLSRIFLTLNQPVFALS